MCRFTYVIDAGRLRELWADPDYSIAEIAREFGLLRSQLQDAVKRYELGPRKRTKRACSMQDGGCKDEAASEASLSLSPWVQARIRELNLGMPA